MTWIPQLSDFGSWIPLLPTHNCTAAQESSQPTLLPPTLLHVFPGICFSSEDPHLEVSSGSIGRDGDERQRRKESRQSVDTGTILGSSCLEPPEKPCAVHLRLISPRGRKPVVVSQTSFLSLREGHSRGINSLVVRTSGFLRCLSG